MTRKFIYLAGRSSRLWNPKDARNVFHLLNKYSLTCNIYCVLLGIPESESKGSSSNSSWISLANGPPLKRNENELSSRVDHSDSLKENRQWPSNGARLSQLNQLLNFHIYYTLYCYCFLKSIYSGTNDKAFSPAVCSLGCPVVRLSGLAFFFTQQTRLNETLD